ncbi:origin of replication complex subunit 1-like [Canna indica]|uniref:Origin recognition complex subunit 1 n=1 Tax=Canna indica TaxID=4628 RepID=A0AAQ3KRC8_9LILI|nr:origin of replication complex subunit 1-like [Canna indica]
MESTPTPSRPNLSTPVPPTPKSAAPRRSLRLTSSASRSPALATTAAAASLDTPRSTRKTKRSLAMTTDTSVTKPSAFAPITPESKRARRSMPSSRTPKMRVYYNKVVYDDGEFEVGDDVYVKRREGAESDDDDPEMEVCRVCFREGRTVMIECDDCLGGFHLKCLKPPLRKIPEGDWVCGFCEARKMGKEVEFPNPPKGRKLRRTAKEKLLSSDLWAARIESLWREPDGTYWLKCRWYIIPEETAIGRQPHNLKRELYRTNDYSQIEMESVIRHCYVLSPDAYKEANDQGDDVFYCEYEYDVHWHNFKRVTDIDDGNENDKGVETDEEWKIPKDSDIDQDSESEEPTRLSHSGQRKHESTANLHKGRTFGLEKIGIKRIPEHARFHKQTDLEKAKAMLLLATLPKSLPCRTREMEEITAFVKGAISGDHCLGRCLYIHGVPGTGKTMCVLSAMRNLKSEVDAGTLRPYTFVEINGLKVASPENIYKVIYEALSGHRVGWKKALHLLNECFSNGSGVHKDERIANTLDLPEKLLPRISSRMGIQRLCFGPYTYQQLQEIISSRLNGLDAFEEQAVEFASRKVAAMSGDARRALEICRRAAEIVDYQLKQSLLSGRSSSSLDNSFGGKQLVGMTDIEDAIHEVFQAPHIQMMKTSSKLAKIFLVAMVHQLYRSGLSETTFEKLFTTVVSLCSSNGEVSPVCDALMKVGCKLGESRIILCEEATKHRLQKLQLNVPRDRSRITWREMVSKDLPLLDIEADIALDRAIWR